MNFDGVSLIQNSRILVRCSHTHCLLSADAPDAWVIDQSAAQWFWSVDEAVRVCRENRLADVDIVIHRWNQPPLIMPVITA